MLTATAKKVLTAMTGDDFTDKTWSDYKDTSAYKMASWFFGGGNSSIDNILGHFQIANAIIRNGKNVFYTSDLFETAGHYINGLSMHQIVEPTGHTRKTFIDLGNGYAKMLEAQEWELVIDVKEFAQQIDAIRSYLFTAIMDTNL